MKRGACFALRAVLQGAERDAKLLPEGPLLCPGIRELPPGRHVLRRVPPPPRRPARYVPLRGGCAGGG